MITPSLPSNFANAVAPYNPVGRSAVSEENLEPRITSFKPVEELQESSRQDNSRNSPAERAVLAEDKVLIGGREQGSREDAESDDERSQSQQQATQEEEEQAQIAELASRDREVRAHEAAHAAIGGTLAGTPSFQYQRGPDGVSYAVGGEVPIKTGNVPGDPEATLRNAQLVQRAALAPAEPSPQDRRVAAEAAQLELQALQEIAARAAQERAMEAEEAENQRQLDQQEKQEQEAAAADKEAEDANSVITADSEVDPQLQEFRQTSIDIGRRLIEIGAIQNPSPSGSLINISA